jgi:hypothetical protein
LALRLMAGPLRQSESTRIGTEFARSQWFIWQRHSVEALLLLAVQVVVGLALAVMGMQ